MSVRRQLQFPHGDISCGFIEVLAEHVPYARSLFILCPERRPVPVEVGFYDTVECPYSGLSVPDPSPSLTTLAGWVAPLFNGPFDYFPPLPSLGKGQVVTDIEPPPFALQVTNVERPKPTAPADPHSQAGQVTVP